VNDPVKSSLSEITYELGIYSLVMRDVLEKEWSQEVWFEIGFLRE
jgi:hypothetical protein